jgi:hypothetical protein
MRGSGYLPYVLTGVAAGCVAGSIALGVRLARKIRRWRARNPNEIEKLRRLQINRVGRIACAEIVDLIENGPPEKPSRVLVYRYRVAGVTYEAAQEVSSFAGLPSLPDTFSGLEPTVKYDPRKPTSSIIACEEWTGLKLRDPTNTTVAATSDKAKV